MNEPRQILNLTAGHFSNYVYLDLHFSLKWAAKAADHLPGIFAKSPTPDRIVHGML